MQLPNLKPSRVVPDPNSGVEAHNKGTPINVACVYFGFRRLGNANRERGGGRDSASANKVGKVAGTFTRSMIIVYEWSQADQGV